jgi:hypothetical protein
METERLSRQLMQKPGPKPKRQKRGRWKRSAETRRKMAEAQRARWQKKREAENAKDATG